MNWEGKPALEKVSFVAAKRFGALSPLRYPGGKAALAGLFADIFGALDIENPRYVEPYAGGAGAGIALLREGIVDQLLINDIDPAVYAFWKSIIDHNDHFLELVNTVPLTICEWHRQRAIYRSRDSRDLLSLGFAFFYLNRTNRSGVINAGVIGGQAQDGTYRIDARFNRATLSERIAAIGRLSDRIVASNLDGRTVIHQCGDDCSTFLYIDPPYVEAGSRLYLNSFDGRDHLALATAVKSISNARWLVTYDMSPLIERQYAGQYQALLEIKYSAHRPSRARELLIASPEVALALRKTLEGVQVEAGT